MMDMEKEINIKLQAAKEIYVIFSGATNCPYVVCDPDTADDEVFIYLKKADGQKERDRLEAEKIPVALGIVQNRQFLNFYTSLYTMGVNALMVNDGKKTIRVQLSDIVRRRLPDPDTDGKTWIENPELHLTAIYLMQEIRKAPQSEPTPEEQELFDEIRYDLNNARLIQPVVKDQKAIPMLQMRTEKFQPMFTDILEFQKFNKDGQFRPLIVEAKEIGKILLPEASGIIINPAGVNLPLQINRGAAREKRTDQVTG